MSDLEIFSPEPKEDPSESDPIIDLQPDYRPDLTALGIEETERGVCEDNYENRGILRRADLHWDAVYDTHGRPTGLIAARSKESLREKRIISLSEKIPLLADPKDRNSDYVVGLQLLGDDDAIRLTPPWVVSATRKYLAEQASGGPASPNRAPLAQPQRCRVLKDDGIRCMYWSSGRIKDDGLCRVHLKHVRKPGEDIERARKKIIQAAPYAADALELLMETAESEPVRLKAITEILDRAGVRGGSELLVDVEVNDARSPAVVIQERLARLAEGVAARAALEAAASADDGEPVTDAEIVEDSTD